jgi:hypothetical protein
LCFIELLVMRLMLWHGWSESLHLVITKRSLNNFKICLPFSSTIDFRGLRCLDTVTFFVVTMQWIETNIIIICQVFIPCIPIDGIIHMAGPLCKTHIVSYPTNKRLCHCPSDIFSKLEGVQLSQKPYLNSERNGRFKKLNCDKIFLAQLSTPMSLIWSLEAWYEKGQTRRKIWLRSIHYWKTNFII